MKLNSYSYYVLSYVVPVMCFVYEPNYYGTSTPGLKLRTINTPKLVTTVE